MRNGPVVKYMLGEEPPAEKPSQYLKGWTEFFKLKFKVTPDVLIPRPETELLVAEVITWINNHEPTNQLTILDLGTGSGCIAISIVKNLPKAKIFATDISEVALQIAKTNAKSHRVENRIFFLRGDLLSFYNTEQLTQNGRSSNVRQLNPDIIVTNLPYIPTSRIHLLDPSVRDFEPRIALDGGSDGFELYRKLFSQMEERNIIPKILIAEIDYKQGEIALSEAKKYFPDAKAEIKTDLNKNQRILLISFGTSLS